MEPEADSRAAVCVICQATSRQDIHCATPAEVECIKERLDKLNRFDDAKSKEIGRRFKFLLQGNYGAAIYFHRNCYDTFAEALHEFQGAHKVEEQVSCVEETMWSNFLIDRIQSELDDVTEQSKELQILLENKNEEGKTLLSTQVSLRAEAEFMQHERETFRNQLKEARNQCGCLSDQMTALITELESTREEKASLSNQVRSLRIENECMQHERETFRNQLEEARNQCSCLSDQMTILTAALESTKEEEASLSNQMRSLQAENEKIHKERETIRRERDTFHNKLENMKEQRERLETEINIMSGHNAALTTELENTREEKASLVGQVESLKTDKESMQNERNTFQNQLEDAKNQRRRLSDQMTILTTELESTKEEKASLSNQMRSLQTENECMQHERETFRNQLEEARNQCSCLSDQMTILTAALESTKEEEASLSNQMRSLQAENENMQIERDTFQNQLEQTKNQYGRISDEMTILTTELESMKEEKASFSNQMRSLQTENENMQTERDTFQNQLEQIRNQYGRLSDQMTILTTELESTKEEKASLSNQMRSLQTENEKIDIERETIRRERDTFQKKLENMKEKRQRLEMEVNHTSLHNAALTKKLESTREQKESLVGQVESLRTDKESMQTERDRFRNQLEQTRNKYGRLSDQMRSLQTENEKLLDAQQSYREETEKQLICDRNHQKFLSEITAEESSKLVTAKFLLERYERIRKSASKPMILNLLLVNLHECIQKNSTITTEAITKMLESNFDSLRKTYKENPFDDHFCLALELRCCRSVICLVGGLWKKYWSKISISEYLSHYRKLVKDMRPFFSLNEGNDLLCHLFTLMRFGLIEDIKDIKHICQSTTLDGEERDRLQSLKIKNTDPRKYLNMLLGCEKETLDDWYELREDLSTRRSTAIRISPCKPVKKRFFGPDSVFCRMRSDSKLQTIIFHVGEAEHKTAIIEETKELKSLVDSFMQNLGKRIAEQKPKLKFSPLLVGSAKENTRSYFPDEFDYLLVFKALMPNFKIKEVENNVLFELENTNEEFKDLIFSHAQFKYLDSEKLRTQLNDAIERAIKTDRASLPEKLRKSLCASTVVRCNEHKLCDDRRLSVEPVGYFTRKIKFPTINLVWRGEHLPDLEIQIDVVPAVECDESKQMPEHAYIKKPGQLHIIAYNSPACFRIGYSAVESQLLKDLPANVLKGFKYAKAMRIAKVLQTSQDEHSVEFVDNFEDLITTYMLKTALFFLTQNSREDTDHPLEWTIKIYRKLKDFLSRDRGRIPHFFLNNEDHPEEDCLFKCDPNRQHSYENEKKHLLSAVNRILEVLTKSYFNEVAETDCLQKDRIYSTEKSMLSMELIGGQLCCCGPDGIHIFSKKKTQF